MAVSGAQATGAAVHRMRLECSSPGRRPEEEYREQAKQCAQFLSRSDRKLERSTHLQKGYPNATILSYRNPTLIAPYQMALKIAILDLRGWRDANCLYGTHLYGV